MRSGSGSGSVSGSGLGLGSAHYIILYYYTFKSF